MKVLHVVAAPVLGGAQELVCQFAVDQGSRGFGVSVVTSPGGPLSARIRDLGIPVQEIPLEHGLAPSAVVKLSRLIRGQKLDLVHAHGARAALATALATFAGSAPFLSHVHLADGWRWNNSWRAKLDRFVAVRAERVVACSASLGRDLVEKQRIPARLLAVIPNGIDLKRFARSPSQSQARESLGLPATAKLAGCCVRLEAQKGIAVLIEAFARIAARMPELALVIAGEGRLKSNLEERARQSGLEGRIHWLGWQRDVPTVLAALDVYVLPSLEEGLPLGVLEAMAAGLPVLATAVGGTPDAVESGTTGILVPPHDPDALATGLLRLLLDPGESQALAAAGRRFVTEHHSAEVMCRKVRTLYSEVLGGSKT